MQHLYNFRFAEAEKLRDRIQLGTVEHGFSSVQIAWWRIVSGQDSPALRTVFQEGLTEVQAATANVSRKSTSGDTLFYLINLHALAARLDLLDKEFYKGIGHLSKSIDYLKSSFGREDEHPPLLLTSGLYNYFMNKAQRSYPYLIPYLLLYPKGNRELGMAQLEKASAAENKLIKTEAIYFLTKIWLESEVDAAKAKKYAGKLIGFYPANLLYRSLYLRSLIASNDFEGAAMELALLKKRCEKFPHPSCDHFIYEGEKQLAEAMAARRIKDGN